MLSFTVKLVLTVAALVVLEIVRRLWAQSHKLKHLKTVARDNFFSGSRFRFFGRGRDSQNLVLQTSKQFNYEPWVVPGMKNLSLWFARCSVSQELHLRLWIYVFTATSRWI